MKYFACDSDGDYNFFDTEDEAIKFAKDAIERYRDDAQDGYELWDDVERVCWGVVKQVAKECNRRDKPDMTGMSDEEIEDIESEFGEFEYLVDYQLEDLDG